MSSFIIINLLFMFVLRFSSSDLPDYFPRCYTTDSDLNNCILKAANALRPQVRQGIQEIKFPSLEPLTVSTFSVAQESQLVNYTSKVWNFTLRGLDNYDFKDIQFDPAKLTFHGKLNFDSVSINTSYELKGRLLHIPVQGKGTAKATLGPINGSFEIKGKINNRKNVKYYSPIETKIRMTIKDGDYFFDGLLEDEVVARRTNELINENSKEITDAVTPALERLAEVGLLTMMKSLTEAVPYYKLFPPSK